MAKSVKEKREHRRLNAFDVMLILLMICLVAALGYRVYSGVSSPDVVKDSKCIVEFECDGVYNSLIDYIDNNEVVYFKNSGEVFGCIYMGKEDLHALEIVTDAVDPEEESSGDEEEISYELVKARGKLKLNADAIASDEGNYFTVGDIGFTVGSIIEVYTDDAVFTLKITAIQTIE